MLNYGWVSHFLEQYWVVIIKKGKSTNNNPMFAFFGSMFN